MMRFGEWVKSKLAERGETRRQMSAVSQELKEQAARVEQAVARLGAKEGKAK